MNKEFFITDSRRTTPWTGDADATELQHFIDRKVDALYANKHMAVTETDESELLNSYEPQRCPYCGHEEYTGYGRTRNGVKRYCCKSCHRTFTIITGTIFQDHKIPISEWIDFCLCLFRFQSFTSISKANRNAYSTVKYLRIYVRFLYIYIIKFYFYVFCILFFTYVFYYIFSFITLIINYNYSIFLYYSSLFIGNFSNCVS